MEGIPPYPELLEYIDLQACDGEDDFQEEQKRLVGKADKKDLSRPSYSVCHQCEQ